MAAEQTRCLAAHGTMKFRDATPDDVADIAAHVAFNVIGIVIIFGSR